jgi:hypothetical protein
MEKIVNKLINHMIKGVDTYTHNGSTWLIFTDKKEWVVELTEEKTLWYNYNFFKRVFAYVSMDVVENQSYITKWVEGNIIGGVGQTQRCSQVSDRLLEVTIQNGVKENSFTYVSKIIGCVGAIENGVKETRLEMNITEGEVDDIIQDGVKETMFNQGHQSYTVKNIIENGVRHTLNTEYMPTSMVEDIIQSGVKETKGHGFEQQNIIDDIVKDGVKETKTPGKDGDILSTIEWMEENKSTSYTKMIDDVIDNGIKEVQPLPDQSGELIGYGNYYKLKEDRTKPFIDYLEDTIKFGVKESLG